MMTPTKIDDISKILKSFLFCKLSIKPSCLLYHKNTFLTPFFAPFYSSYPQATSNTFFPPTSPTNPSHFFAPLLHLWKQQTSAIAAIFPHHRTLLSVAGPHFPVSNAFQNPLLY